MSDDIALPPPATQRSRSTVRRAPSNTRTASTSRHPSSMLRAPSTSRTASTSQHRPLNGRNTSSFGSRVTNPLRTGTPDTNASRQSSFRSWIASSLRQAKDKQSDDSLSLSSEEETSPVGSVTSTVGSGGLTDLIRGLQDGSGTIIHRKDIDKTVRRRVREKKDRARVRRAVAERGWSGDEEETDTEFTRWRRGQESNSNLFHGPHASRKRRERDASIQRARDLSNLPAPTLPTVVESDRRSPRASADHKPTSSSSSHTRALSPEVIQTDFDAAHDEADVRHPRDRFFKFDQNLNEPFLPPTKEEKTNLASRVVGPVWRKLTAYERPSAVGMNVNTPGTGTLEDNRAAMSTITALITTSGNLLGPATPTLSAIGPAWEGQDGPNAHAHRRLARYGRREAIPDYEARDRLEAVWAQDQKVQRRANRATRRDEYRIAQSPGGSPGGEKPRRGRSVSFRKDVADGEELGDVDSDERDEMQADEVAQGDVDHVAHKEGDGSEVKEGGGKILPTHETTIPEESDSATDGISDDTISDPEGQRDDIEKGPRKIQYAGWVGSKRGERQQQEIFITRHRTTQTQARDYIVRFANALLSFGAPTHRIEGQLESAARVLEVDAHFFYLPGILILSFSKPEQQSSETAFLRCTGELDVQSLRRVHKVSRAVLHDHISALDGARRLQRITNAPPRHAVWQRIIIIAACSFFASSVVFSGSFVDMLASAILGGLMGLCQHTLAAWNPLFSNCFEIAMAFLISFFAKALSATGYFCYASLTSAGIVMILPGYVLLTATLELASKVMVPGSIRLVFGVLLSLFLGTGISLGSKLYVLIDPTGSETPSSSTTASSGGSVVCARRGDEPWYQAPITPWLLFVTLPGFAISLALWTKARLRTNQTVATLVIAFCSYASYYFANQIMASEPEVSSAVGAAVVGLLGTLWSRVARGTAFTTQSAAILLLVPNGLAAAGGIVMSSSSGTQSFYEGAQVALRQIQTSVGVTIGLFVASLLTYLGSAKKRGNILSY